jgi:hypothetical protein
LETRFWTLVEIQWTSKKHRYAVTWWIPITETSS